MTEPKYRRPLNPKQLDILIILYKFRYATVDLFCDYLHIKNQRYMYERLKNLVEQGYVGKRFTEQDKINRKPALFYLVPDGLKLLQAKLDINPKALLNLYRDPTRSDLFIEDCLMILKLHNKLSQLYGKNLEFYSKAEISDYSFFPKTSPDAYLLLKNQPYMLDWLPASTIYQSLRGRISQLLRHYDSGEWSDSGLNYPTMLFICANPYIERQVQRIAKRSFNKAEEQGIAAEGLTVLTTTLKAFNSAQSSIATIWTDVGDSEDPVSLINQASL